MYFQIRFTYLEVPKTTMKEMKERPANRPGPLNVDKMSYPYFTTVNATTT